MTKASIDLHHKPLLVTGAAGFIGAALVIRLLRENLGGRIVGLDDLNDYYDPALKRWRLEEIRRVQSSCGGDFTFIQGSVADKSLIDRVFSDFAPRVVVHLAAQAGVRYSIDHPEAYIESNIVGFFNILEACRHAEDLRHLVYASSSSVYGGNTKVPFSVEDRVDHPVSLYAATKKCDELLAHAYGKLYDIPSTGLRFFTVYGPAGRPDMFYYSATEKLLRGQTLQLFNYGDCLRDFTYIDDIVEGVYRVMGGAPTRQRGPDGLPIAPCAIYNIGGGRPENLMDFVRTLHGALIEAGLLPEDHDLADHLVKVPMQPGDVKVTFADSAPLQADYGFTPEIHIREGLARFARWYREYTDNVEI